MKRIVYKSGGWVKNVADFGMDYWMGINKGALGTLTGGTTNQFFDAAHNKFYQNEDENYQRKHNSVYGYSEAGGAIATGIVSGNPTGSVSGILSGLGTGISNTGARTYKKGGPVNGPEGDLISKVIMNRNRDKDFVQRAYAVGNYPNSNMFSLFDPEEFGSKMSHKMSWGEDDKGQYWMYPTIMNRNNEAIKIPNQYAGYISSEGYKKAVGMYKKGGPVKYQESSPAKKVNPYAPVPINWSNNKTTTLQDLINQQLEPAKRDATSTRNYAKETMDTDKHVPYVRDDTKLAPKGSIRSGVQKIVNAMHHAGDPKIEADGTVIYQSTPLDPIVKHIVAPMFQSGINVANTIMGDRPIRNDDDIANFGMDALMVAPLVASTAKGAKYLLSNMGGYKKVPKPTSASASVENVKPSFKSEIDWVNWIKKHNKNYDAEDIQNIIKNSEKYNIIEQQTKANGTWMKYEKKVLDEEKTLNNKRLFDEQEKEFNIKNAQEEEVRKSLYEADKAKIKIEETNKLLDLKFQDYFDNASAQWKRNFENNPESKLDFLDVKGVTSKEIDNALESLSSNVKSREADLLAKYESVPVKKFDRPNESVYTTSIEDFPGTPEQFIQVNSENFKKAYPEGWETVWRGGDRNPELNTKYIKNGEVIFTSKDEYGANVYNRSDNPEIKLSNTETSQEGLVKLYAPKTENKIVIDGDDSYIYDGRRISGDNYRKNYARLDAMNQTPITSLQQENLNTFQKWMRKNYPEVDLTDRTMTDHFASFLNSPEGRNIDRVEFKKIFDGTLNPIDVEVHNLNNKKQLKSMFGNNGMFDMTNPNIHKGLVPAGIVGAAALQQNETPKYAKGGRVKKYGDGGKVKPIITNDPNDPRLKAYQDSLNVYNSYKNLKEKLDKPGSTYHKSPNILMDIASLRTAGREENIKSRNPDGTYNLQDLDRNIWNTNLDTQLVNPRIKPKGKEFYFGHIPVYPHISPDNIHFGIENRDNTMLTSTLNYLSYLAPGFDIRGLYDYSNAEPVQPVIYQAKTQSKLATKKPVVIPKLKEKPKEKPKVVKAPILEPTLTSNAQEQVIQGNRKVVPPIKQYNIETYTAAGYPMIDKNGKTVRIPKGYINEPENLYDKSNNEISMNPVKFKHGGQTNQVLINVEGKELRVDPKNLSVLADYKNLPKHPDNPNFINPQGNVTANEGDIIVPKNMRNKYLMGDTFTKKAIIATLKHRTPETKFKPGGPVFGSPTHPIPTNSMQFNPIYGYPGNAGIPYTKANLNPDVTIGPPVKYVPNTSFTIPGKENISYYYDRGNNKWYFENKGNGTRKPVTDLKSLDYLNKNYSKGISFKPNENEEFSLESNERELANINAFADAKTPEANKLFNETYLQSSSKNSKSFGPKPDPLDIGASGMKAGSKIGTGTEFTPMNTKPYQAAALGAGLASAYSGIDFLLRHRKPYTTTYNTASPSFLNPDEAVKAVNSAYSGVNYSLRNIGTPGYLSNRIESGSRQAGDLAKTRMEYDNTNAQIGNNFSQFNTQIKNLETDANERNRDTYEMARKQAFDQIAKSAAGATKDAFDYKNEGRKVDYLNQMGLYFDENGRLVFRDKKYTEDR